MFTKILVPLDNSALAEQALPTAQSLARSSGATIDLVYVHVPHPFDGFPDAPWNAARRSSEDSYIRAIAQEVRTGAGIPIAAGLTTGSAADAICAHAEQIEADLIVMTSHGRTGVSRAWLGSVADGVVRQASVPVLLMRPAEEHARTKGKCASFKRILVPLDGSLSSESILGPAAALAATDGGKLIMVEIVPPVPLVVPDITMSYILAPTIPDPEATEALVNSATKRLQATAAQLLESGIAGVETHVVVSEFPAQAVLDAARAHSADVIAMTTSGRGTSRLVVGSIADKVMRACNLPLLMSRPMPVAPAEPVQEVFSAALTLVPV